MKKNTKNKIIALFLFSVILTAFGGIAITYAQSQQYTPLAPLPGIDAATPTNLGSYANAMVKILIGIAAVLAIIMIMIGGLQYMSTDAISGKTEGKERITQALFGLGLAIASWLILYTISPTLLKVDLSVSSNIPQSRRCFETERECETQLRAFSPTTQGRCIETTTACRIVRVTRPVQSGGSYEGAEACFFVNYTNCQPQSTPSGSTREPGESGFGILP